MTVQLRGAVFEPFMFPLPVFSPVCCSSKLPWEGGPLLWPLLSAICCSRGTSTEVSHDRDWRSPGRSSTRSWEGSVVRSLQGRRRRRQKKRIGDAGGFRVNTAVSLDTQRSQVWLKSKDWREDFYPTKTKPFLEPGSRDKGWSFALA